MGRVRSSLLLGAAMLLAGIACGVGGGWRGLDNPWPAASVAAFVCWAAGTAGLLATHWAVRRWQAHGVLIGTAVRMAAPLACGAIASKVGGELASNQLFAMTVFCYLIMLAVETALALQLLKPLNTSTNLTTDSTTSPVTSN